MAIEFYCTRCGQLLRVGDESAGKQARCPQCGNTVAVPASPSEPVVVPSVARYSSGPAVQYSGTKIAAGICAILVGSLGIHKFILGYTTAGIIMLLVTLLTCGIGGIAMHVIGIVEGILYLSKTDEEFYQRYVVEKREWF